MNDARVDHIEEKLDALDRKVDGLGVQTQSGFDDHRRYAEFLWQGVRDDMSKRFNQVERRFDSVDERFDRVNDRFKGVDQRFDGMDERFDRVDERFDRMDDRFDRMDKRFDRLEQLIKER